MDSSEYLRILARLDVRAFRAERAQCKLEQTFEAVQTTLRVANEEKDHVSKLADIFFDLSQMMGSVIDYLLKERGSKEPDQEPESTKELQRVLEEDPPKSTTTSIHTKLSSNVLEPAFEWDRNRRSAAPSPELLPGHESQELSGSMLGEANPGRLDILVPSVGKQADCRCCDAGSLTNRVALLAVREDI
ncbi:hypothetical protein MYU51_019569 [Penicillium brevicompactum]